MSAYDDNMGLITIPENSVISSLNSNTGRVTVGRNCTISECHDNMGSIQFGSGLRIGSIIDNMGGISIENGSKVDLIADNCGRITLASDCVVMLMEDNLGSIVRGKQNFNSANFQYSDGGASYHFRCSPQSSFSSTVFVGGVRSGRKDEFLRTIFNNLNLGSFGQGSFSKKNSQGLTSKSNCSNSKANGSTRHRENVLVPTAPESEDLTPPVSEDPTPPVSEDVDERLCAICMDSPKNTAFQCGHLCCLNCSEMLTSCHICRVKIDQKIKLFL